MRGWLLLFMFSAVGAFLPSLSGQDLHAITIIDSATGRGVPLVEVTLNGQSHYTDSAGLVALEDPTLLNQNLPATVNSYGYEGFGQLIQTTAGGTSQLSIRRNNLAERLYRITGTGIYEHSVLAGVPTPIKHPLLNANVRGQDSVQSVVYNNKVHWFWGDTLYENGFGNFRTAGATTDLPALADLSPSEGLDLNYYVNSSGSARQMMPLEDPGPVWVDGLFTIAQPNGQESMLAHFVRVQSFSPYLLYEQGMALFLDSSEEFRRFRGYDLDAPITPAGHSFRHQDGNEDYIYFAQSYPSIRVRDVWSAMTDIQQWEAFTPLLENSRYDTADPPLERDSEGNLVFGWKKNTDPLTTEMIVELEQNGFLNREETPFRLKDYQTGAAVRLHRSSVHWNDYRQSWIMIGTESWGDSFLGEIWFAESTEPEGPWDHAVKVVTHDGGPAGDYSFYNPTTHPFFDEDGGRLLYFEGTYTATFSGNMSPTPLYDYNQVMYRLDLADVPRLISDRYVDLNGDGEVNCQDVDELVAQIVSGVHPSYFDLDGDGTVNDGDLSLWLAGAGALLTAGGGPLLPGDANLDGVVDLSDLHAWNAHRFRSTSAWCQGDFNADGETDVLDFAIWNQHKFQSSTTLSVAEPLIPFDWLGIAGAVLFRRRPEL